MVLPDTGSTRLDGSVLFDSDESSGKVAGYKIIGKLALSDYEKLEPEIKALVKKEGSNRNSTWIADYKLGHELRNKVEKISVVGDTTWEKWLTHLSKMVYATDARFFQSADISKAWAWLRE